MHLVDAYNPRPNIDETRFKRGFYRRSAQSILNPAKQEIESYSSYMKEKQSDHANRRSEYLRNKDTANGKISFINPE